MNDEDTPAHTPEDTLETVEMTGNDLHLVVNEWLTITSALFSVLKVNSDGTISLDTQIPKGSLSKTLPKMRGLSGILENLKTNTKTTSAQFASGERMRVIANCDSDRAVACGPREVTYTISNLKNGKNYEIETATYKNQCIEYDPIDVMVEYKRMQSWIDNAPESRRPTKTGANRFINRWLLKALRDQVNRKESNLAGPRRAPERRMNNAQRLMWEAQQLMMKENSNDEPESKPSGAAATDSVFDMLSLAD